MGYGDATDGAIAVGAELELTGGPQRFQLPENLLQDPMAEGNTTAHVFLAGDEDSHSPWTDSQGPRQLILDLTLLFGALSFLFKLYEE